MFTGIKSWLYMALAAGGIYLATSFLGFIGDAMENAAENVRLEAQLGIRDARIATLETEKRAIEDALEIAEEERQFLVLRNEELRYIRDRALTAGEEDDGEIAPVLGDTLRALSE